MKETLFNWTGKKQMHRGRHTHRALFLKRMPEWKITYFMWFNSIVKGWSRCQRHFTYLFLPNKRYPRSCQKCKPEELLKLPLWIKTKVQKVKGAGYSWVERTNVPTKKALKKTPVLLCFMGTMKEAGTGWLEGLGLRYTSSLASLRSLLPHSASYNLCLFYGI